MQKKYLFGMAAMPLPLSCTNCIDDNNLSLCLYPVSYRLIKVVKPQLGVCLHLAAGVIISGMGSMYSVLYYKLAFLASLRGNLSST